MRAICGATYALGFYQPICRSYGYNQYIHGDNENGTVLIDNNFTERCTMLALRIDNSGPFRRNTQCHVKRFEILLTTNDLMAYEVAKFRDVCAALTFGGDGSSNNFLHVANPTFIQVRDSAVGVFTASGTYAVTNSQYAAANGKTIKSGFISTESRHVTITTDPLEYDELNLSVTDEGLQDYIVLYGIEVPGSSNPKAIASVDWHEIF